MSGIAAVILGKKDGRGRVFKSEAPPELVQKWLEGVRSQIT